MTRTAFTIVELMVCVVVAALLTTLAVANLRAGHRSANLRGAVAEFQSADRTMRDRARHLAHPGQLRIDLSTGAVTRVESGHETPLASFRNETRISAIYLPSGPLTEGAATIPCPAGRTPSYAVLISAGAQQQWLVVPGLTGQFEPVDHEDHVRDIFRHPGAPALD